MSALYSDEKSTGTRRTLKANFQEGWVHFAAFRNQSYLTNYVDKVYRTDGLSLFFQDGHPVWPELPLRPGGCGLGDLWVTTRQTLSDDWGMPENLGPTVNTAHWDGTPCISADGLMLYFASDRPGGSGNTDIWIITQRTSELVPEGYWGTPTNLGSTVNSPYEDGLPCVSADGLELYFYSNRPGGYGGFDAWVTTRATKDDDWGTPVNLGPTVNTSAFDGAATISADGSTMYFMSGRPGGAGSHDLWQVSIELVVDLNGDPSPHLEPVLDELRRADLEARVEVVPYEFQRGGNRMLRIRAPEGGGWPEAFE